MKRACPPLLALALAVGCHHSRVDSGSEMNPLLPRPAVIPADGGEKRFLRGSDTLSNFFVFSSPGFERALRAVSSAPGEPPIALTPQLRRAAFHDAHAVADPSDC